MSWDLGNLDCHPSPTTIWLWTLKQITSLSKVWGFLSLEWRYRTSALGLLQLLHDKIILNINFQFFRIYEWIIHLTPLCFTSFCKHQKLQYFFICNSSLSNSLISIPFSHLQRECYSEYSICYSSQVFILQLYAFLPLSNIWYCYAFLNLMYGNVVKSMCILWQMKVSYKVYVWESAYMLASVVLF